MVWSADGSAFLFSLINTFFPDWLLRNGITPHLYYESAVVIITLVLFGKYIEEKSKIGTGKAIDDLMDLQRGKTVLLCSHLLSDVEDLCDRVAIMYGGRLRAEGTCDELLQEEGTLVLQTSEISEQTLIEVRTVLSAHQATLTKVERPRRRLESLFLEIVEQARAEGLATSGANNGGRVAAFLAAGDDQTEGAESVNPAEPSPAEIDTQLLDSLVNK